MAALGLELTTPGSAVRCGTDCAMEPAGLNTNEHLEHHFPGLQKPEWLSWTLFEKLLANIHYFQYSKLPEGNPAIKKILYKKKDYLRILSLVN